MSVKFNFHEESLFQLKSKYWIKLDIDKIITFIQFDFSNFYADILFKNQSNAWCMLEYTIKLTKDKRLLL